MAYTTATLVGKDDPSPDGRVRIVIEFTGNAGEPPIRRDRFIDDDTTIPGLRQWCFAEASGLTGRKTVADQLNIGAAITLTAPPAPPGLTARAIWLEKAARLQRFRSLQLTNGTAVTDLAALASDVNATYLTAYSVSI